MTYNKIRILFIGTVEFSFTALSVLLENNFEVVGLITKSESKFNSDYKDLTLLAKNYSLPIKFKTKDNEEELISFIQNINSDVVYCFGWSHILPNRILEVPPYGVVGFHPAELPKNRGRHPIIWALALGLKQTASTFFLMDEGADTGDIISQEKINISAEDNAHTLYEKITDVALNQIVSFTKGLEQNKGNIKRVVQNKLEGNNWRKRNKTDGKIDFRMSSDAIFNLVRALTHPYVGAHIETKKGDIKVWKVSKPDEVYLNNFEPGKVLDILNDNKIVVKTYDSAIVLEKHEFVELPKKDEYL